MAMDICCYDAQCPTLIFLQSKQNMFAHQVDDFLTKIFFLIRLQGDMVQVLIWRATRDACIAKIVQSMFAHQLGIFVAT